MNTAASMFQFATSASYLLKAMLGKTACRLNSDGLRQLVQWQDWKTVSNVTERIRVRIDFDGIRFEDTRLYAIYLDAVI